MSGLLGKIKKSRLAAAGELLVEFVHATGGIDEALFTSVDRVGVHRDIAEDHEMFFPIDNFLTVGSQHGACRELLAGGNIDEANFVQFRMNILLHLD